MSGRLAGKVALVVGAGQTPGDTIGNGRATAILFAREGARVMVVDRRLDSAQETLEMIEAENGAATAHQADATIERDCEAMIAAVVERFGQIDVLHNNVGIGGADAGPAHIDEEVWAAATAERSSSRPEATSGKGRLTVVLSDPAVSGESGSASEDTSLADVGRLSRLPPTAYSNSIRPATAFASNSLSWNSATISSRCVSRTTVISTCPAFKACSASRRFARARVRTSSR